MENRYAVTDKNFELIDQSIINRLKEMAPGDPEFLNDVVNMFSTQSPEILREMEEGCNKKEYERMGQAAHKLKGSALNIGARKLAELCREIEIQGRSNDGHDCEKKISSVKEIYKRTIEELKGIV
jgi:HPt (histidine-containing phosphotransfer) domain-containing protein